MKIAIVGSGVSGLSALYHLQKYTEHDVVLFEKSDRIGGDAYTIPFQLPGKKEYMVDLAFMLFHEQGWRNTCELMERLGVEFEHGVKAAWSFSGDDGRFEWSSHGLGTVLGKWSNLLNLNMWRMLFDIVRFDHFALDAVRDPAPYEMMTVREYLRLHRYSRAFAECYLIPLLATIWASSLDNIVRMPILKVIRYLHKVKMLQLFNRPPWRVVKGGSKSYIDKLVAACQPGSVHTNMGVESLSTIENRGTELRFSDGTSETFDHVILGLHTDTTRHILRSGECLSDDLDDVLAHVRWGETTFIAHGDTRLMPRDRRLWAGWNTQLVTETLEKSPVRPRTVVDMISCTFNYNRMLDLPAEEYGNIVVSVNPHVPIDKSTILHQTKFTQPLSVPGNEAALRKLSNLQWRAKHVPAGLDLIGAWNGYGMHEDGVISSYECLRRLGVAIPDWHPRDLPLPRLSIRDHTARALIEVLDATRRASKPLWIAMSWLVSSVCGTGTWLCGWYGWHGLKGDLEWVRECWTAGDQMYTWAK